MTNRPGNREVSLQIGGREGEDIWRGKGVEGEERGEGRGEGRAMKRGESK